jgi:fermentation-respiration switch protein FrsA (DUF1100 family)
MIQIAAIVTLLLALLAAMLVMVWVFQERIAFQPPAGPWPSPTDARRVEYQARDGQQLFGYLVGDPDSSRSLLLSFHGNADLAVWQIDWAEEVVRRTGVPVLLAEYRGYMGLSGRPTYEGSRLDAEAAHTFARTRLGVPADRIAVFGHSLGSAVATELAAREQPAALLLQSPFTSAQDMAARMTGYRPADFLWRVISRLHFDTGAKVTQIEAPVSVAHGSDDRLIPPWMGEAIYQAASVPGALLVADGAAHNDLPASAGESYWNWISAALKPSLPDSATASPVVRRNP